jgi:hypothetical protein
MATPYHAPDAGHGDALAQSRADRDRALEAIRALEDAAGQAGPGRDQAWRDSVLTALENLQAAIDDQRSSYTSPMSLMNQAAQDAPTLRAWVRQLHHRWDDLAASTDTLRQSLQTADPEDPSTIADTRDQLRWIIAALHHHRAREADLIFSALNVEIGGTQERGDS